MDTDTELAGILTATDEQDMPRVVATFQHPLFGKVDIIEPVIGAEDGHKRGYLWHAVAGDYFLTPTRRGFHDPDRWVPGSAQLLPGGRLLAFSCVSIAQVIRNARRARVGTTRNR